MKLDDVKKLHQKKYRTQFGYFLVEGEHLILELLKAPFASVDHQNVTLYVTDDYHQWAQQHASHLSCVNVNNKQMSQLSNTTTPPGIIACVPTLSANTVLEQTAHSIENTRYIYLHEVQDPGNLGTILRTLAWFGNFKVLLSPNSVDPFNPKVVRASMGAIFHIQIELEVELTELQQRFERFAYLDMQGTEISASSFADFECYLFGNEARGVPQNALSQCSAQAYTIPGCGSIDSLNLASAVNICAYQLSL